MKAEYILPLIFIISIFSGCNNKNDVKENGSAKTPEENIVESSGEQFEVKEEPVNKNISTAYFTVTNFRNPEEFTNNELEIILDFFSKNDGRQLSDSIALILSNKGFFTDVGATSMTLNVKDFYSSNKQVLLMVRLFYGVGNKLTVFSIEDNKIAAVIDGIILDADSDGSYYMSSKCNIADPGIITITINEEESFIDDTGIKDFVIENTETITNNFRLSVEDNGTISMDDESSSSSRKFGYNMEELETWSKEDLRILRNYIFAKHSYKFKSPDLSEYFNQFDWYEGIYENVDDKLSEADREFVSIVKRIEDSI